MKVVPVEWSGPLRVGELILDATRAAAPKVDLAPIREAVVSGGDTALIELTNRFDAVEQPVSSVLVPLSEAELAADSISSDLREAILLAIENVRIVAEAQVGDDRKVVGLPQGHEVIVGEVPVDSAAVYAPGGRKSYPSSVVMGSIAARAAGVRRVVLATPPGPKGGIDSATLAAAFLCGVDEIYSMGGAQAIYALALGTETIDPVEVIVGPGNTWVQEAKKDVFGRVGIDSPAGPTDLTVVFGPDADLGLVALDLCAQAEHGEESPLTAIALPGADMGHLVAEVERVAAENPSVNECQMFTVEAPDPEACLALLEKIAPEHLQLVGERAEELASGVTTAGCVFVGPLSATAFGDYVAGSNHVLPTGGSGRIFGPLSPATFRRATSRVVLTEGSIAPLADAVEALSEAEGLPVHGLSAKARNRR